MTVAALLQSSSRKPPTSGVSNASGLLQRKCACGSSNSRLDESRDDDSIRPLQKKLAIGPSDDPLEQEADRIADQVMAAPTSPDVNGGPLRIQRYATQATQGPDSAPASVDHVPSSPRRPLEPALQQDIRQRFGHDFSRVRVHSATNAEQSARVMRAPDKCLENCEKQFDRCIKHTAFPPECIAARSVCQRGCTPPTQPSPPDYEDKHACVVKEQIPIITTPVVVFDDSVLMQTNCDIEWETDGKCDCSCGEYRQYVKGHIIKNLKKYEIGLCDGAKLEESTWHEDGDAETKFCPGHRDQPEIKNDIFDRPNRGSGCHYHGMDEPNVPGKPGDMIDVDLKFKGQTYDRCLNRFGEIHEWSFTFKGALGGI